MNAVYRIARYTRLLRKLETHIIETCSDPVEVRELKIMLAKIARLSPALFKEWLAQEDAESK